MLQVSLCGDSTGRKFIQLSRLHTIILHSGCSNIILRDTEHEGLDWFHFSQGWVQWLSPNNMVTHSF